jgi:xanthine dehydrogenase FAD-binding subunit
MRAPAAEAVVNGKPVTAQAVEDFALAVLEDINPRDSWRAAKDFRQHIAVELARRCLTEAVHRCGGEVQ